MDKKDIDLILQEIGGFRPNDPPPGQELPSIGPYSHNTLNNNQPLDQPELQKQKPIQPPFQLNEWQLNLRNLILQRHPRRKDVFVNVMPAGGKTLPLVQAWQLSPGYNIDKSHDRICWVCPTVQLANQVYHQDLKPTLLKNFEELLKQEVNKLQTSPGGLAQRHPGLSITYNQIQEMLLKLTALRTGSGEIGEISGRNLFTVCTYPYAPSIIHTQKPHIVVIDEVQQYFPIAPGPINKDAEKRAEDFIKTIESVSQNSSLIFLTGSMNRDTANQIREFINNTFQRRLEYFNAPEAKNRAYISVIPNSKIRRREDLVALVREKVFQRSPGNCAVVFSVQKTIMAVADTLIRILPKRSIEAITGRSPTIGTQVFNQSEPNVGRSKDPSSMNVFDAAKYSSTEFEDPQYIANWLQHMLNSPPRVEREITPHGPQQRTDVSDPYLAKCIQAGFAYLAGGKDRDRKMTNRDIMIVQTLFKQGKIYFLLATDMIGVGTTLTIKNLYIPRLNKPSEGGFGPIDDSSLVQLLHRVGRRGDISANIFCDPSDFTRIVEVINSNPEEYVAKARFGEQGVSSIEHVVQNTSKNKMVQFILTMLRGS